MDALSKLHDGHKGSVLYKIVGRIWGMYTLLNSSANEEPEVEVIKDRPVPVVGIHRENMLKLSSN